MTFFKVYLLSGGSRGGPPLFLDQKNLGGPAPPLPQGLDDRPPLPTYLKVWIGYCF